VVPFTEPPIRTRGRPLKVFLLPVPLFGRSQSWLVGVEEKCRWHIGGLKGDGEAGCQLASFSRRNGDFCRLFRGIGCIESFFSWPSEPPANRGGGMLCLIDCERYMEQTSRLLPDAKPYNLAVAVPVVTSRLGTRRFNTSVAVSTYKPTTLLFPVLALLLS
jgi:hypothetical protein